MELLTENRLDELLQKQRLFFESHQTKDIQFRKISLKKLLAVVQKYEVEIADSLRKDLHKSFEESYLTEISIVTSEIKYHLKNLNRWARPKKVSTPLHLFPSRSRIQYEPLGIALVISPWNYPFQLIFNPLVGVLSSGCCAILKTSPDSPHTSVLMEKMIGEIFDEDHIAVVHGGKQENQLLFKKRFDHIFFTGSSKLGKIVMRAAAEFLTPVVLELGGKSPCIVDEEAKLDVCAKRIAWSKGINAGQTCIAPDYILVHNKVKEKLIAKVEENWIQMYGENAMESPYYARIVNLAAFDRLNELLSRGEVRSGGQTDREKRYIQPTILDQVKLDDPIMKDEIFGPLLPILSFSDLNEALKTIQRFEKPLALYYYGSSKKAKSILKKSSSGGVCINDGLIHIANHHLPFGGVGQSGFGSYHGHRTFLCFSHPKAIVQTPTWIDLPFRYVPFKWFSWIRKII